MFLLTTRVCVFVLGPANRWTGAQSYFLNIIGIFDLRKRTSTQRVAFRCLNREILLSWVRVRCEDNYCRVFAAQLVCLFWRHWRPAREACDPLQYKYYQNFQTSVHLIVSTEHVWHPATLTRWNLYSIYWCFLPPPPNCGDLGGRKSCPPPLAPWGVGASSNCKIQ